MSATASDLGPISMLFEMARADNPRLYDDLVRFNKGTKRINRLRFLAHEGLLAQSWTLVPTPTATAVSATTIVGAAGIELGQSTLTNQAFGPPLIE